MEIYEILSHLMEDRNLKVAEVARLCDLPDGTVRGIIKREQKDIALKVALKLSKGLGVSIEYLNGMPEREKSPEELRQEKFNQYEHIVDKYHFISTHSPNGAGVVDTILDREYSIAEKLKTQSEQIEKMNKKASEKSIPTRIISYFHRIASAGSGEYMFDDMPTDLIKVQDTPISRSADFVIGVNGDSMEPNYRDGEKVFVQKTPEIEIGEVGIFLRGNECFIKERGKDGLISRNDKYANVEPFSNGIKVVGRVIGKVDE